MHAKFVEFANKGRNTYALLNYYEIYKKMLLLLTLFSCCFEQDKIANAQRAAGLRTMVNNVTNTPRLPAVFQVELSHSKKKAACGKICSEW